MRFNSSSLGSRFQHYFFYFLLQFKLVYLARFCMFFVILYYSLKPSVRKKSSYYRERRFPNDKGLKAFYHAYKINSNFAHLLFERMVFANTSRLTIKSDNKAKNKLLNILDTNSGCLVLSGHLGAWQLGLHEFENLDRVVNIVQLVQEGDKDKHYFQHKTYKNKNSIQFISPQDPLKASLEISSALLRNEIVCMMGDRVLHEQEKCIFMDFLGDKIALPLAPFSISSITQKPLVITFSALDKNSIQGVWAEKLLIPRGIHKQKEALKVYVQRYIVALEYLVEQYPHQFFNFYNLWDLENYDK